MNMQEKSAGIRTRKFSLSDINGLLLVGAVLAGTILSAGATEVRYRMSDSGQPAAADAMKVSHYPADNLKKVQ